MTNEEFIESIRLDGEDWKNVGGFEGLYMVSSEGRVVSLTRDIFQGKSTYTRGPILLKNHIFRVKNLSYYIVRLYRDGKPFPKTVHSLVAKEFIPNPNGYPEIDHINRNGLDNRTVNLRWCTRKMNMANENTRKVLEVCHKGADHSYRWRPVAKLLDGKEIQRYKNITDAAKEGFQGHKISEVCLGRRKSHGGYQWMYLSDYEKRNE